MSYAAGVQVLVPPPATEDNAPWASPVLPHVLGLLTRVRSVAESTLAARQRFTGALEVEARIGSCGEAAFEPGVGRTYYSKMRDYLSNKAASGTWMKPFPPAPATAASSAHAPSATTTSPHVVMRTTSTVDLTFEVPDDALRRPLRVTLDLTAASAAAPNAPAALLPVVAVVRKLQLSRHQDFRAADRRNVKTQFDLRVSAAVEHDVAPDVFEQAKEVGPRCYEAGRAALARARASAAGALPILGGANMSEHLLSGGAVTVREGAATRPIVTPTGILDAAPPLSPEDVAALRWTLVRPGTVRALENRGDVTLHDHRIPPNIEELQLGNLPGKLATPAAESASSASPARYAAAFQFMIMARVADMVPVDSTAGGVGGSGSGGGGAGGYASPWGAPRTVRRKDRVSFHLGRGVLLDMTKTTSAASVAELELAAPKYEIELDLSLASTEEAAAQDPAATAALFTFAVFKYMFGFAMSPAPPTAALQAARDRALLDADALDVHIPTTAARKRALGALGASSSASFEPPPRSTGSASAMLDDDDDDDGEVGGGPPPHPPNGSAAAAASASLSESPRSAKRQVRDADVTSNFYNQLDRDDVTARTSSHIFHMRCLNNFVKSVLLQEAVELVTGRGAPSRELRVLDLACGKGADFFKIQKSAAKAHARLAEYVGVDIARQSLEAAATRILGASGAASAAGAAVRLVSADLGSVSMIPEDGNAAQLEVYARDAGAAEERQGWASRRAAEALGPTASIESGGGFHVISMQFAFHYMFASRVTALLFFRTLARVLAQGGEFVATTVNADVLVSELLQQPGNVVDIVDVESGATAPTCRVEFEKDVAARLLAADASAAEDPNSWYGLKYHFSLADQDGKFAVQAPEYLVPRRALDACCEDFDLEIREQVPLTRFATSRFADNSELWRSMRVPSPVDGGVSAVEWRIAGLYQVIRIGKRALAPAGAPAADVDPMLMIEALQRLQQVHPEWDELADAERDALIAQETAKLAAAGRG